MEFPRNLGGRKLGENRPECLSDNGIITRNLKQVNKDNIKRKSIKQIKHISLKHVFSLPSAVWLLDVCPIKIRYFGSV